MEILGLFLIFLGLFGIIFEGSSSDSEKEILSKFDEIKSSSTVRLIVIDNKKLNIGLIVLGLIIVLV